MRNWSSALYDLEVSHHRVGTVRHGFSYRMASLLLDIDELPALHRSLRLFSWNARGAIAHRDRDHGAHDGTPLRPWAEARLADAGIAFDGGAIRLLAMPRILGSVFNPLSIYYCHAQSGALLAIIYEVHNTFGEHHSYVLPIDGDGSGPETQSCEKTFYVSPFIPMQQRYRFRIKQPGQHLRFAMTQDRAGEPQLFVKLHGTRHDLNDKSLAHLLLSYPLLSLKVLGAIHWEAFRLWRKGAIFQSRKAVQRQGRSAAATKVRLGVERETL